MWLISIDGVLGKGALTPGIGTTYAVNIEIDVQIDETPALDVAGMTDIFQILLTVVPGTDAKGIPAINMEGLMG